MVRTALIVVLSLLVLPAPAHADEADATTIRYTTALSGDGETGGCPNTATLGLALALLSPITNYDWYNLCFGAPRGDVVHVRVVDDSGLPVRASLGVHEANGDWLSFPVCRGEGTFTLPESATEVSVTVHASPLPSSSAINACPIVVPTATPTTGSVTVTYLWRLVAW